MKKKFIKPEVHTMEMQTENVILDLSQGTGNNAPTTAESKISHRFGVRSRLDF